MNSFTSCQVKLLLLGEAKLLMLGEAKLLMLGCLGAPRAPGRGLGPALLRATGAGPALSHEPNRMARISR